MEKIVDKQLCFSVVLSQGQTVCLYFFSSSLFKVFLIVLH